MADEELYREVLLEHYKHPVHQGTLIAPSVTKQDANPLCGDTITVSLEIDDASIIQDVKFEGQGCVIAIASTDLLLSHIKGKKLSQVQAMTSEDMLGMLNLKLTHTRVKCALLGLHTLKKAIITYEAKQ